MSAKGDGDDRQEIIIVKRGGGDHEEGHHGGVWKIAFADFMTAMMCFFLVMWLVSATSEQTKAAVASYFNPMTLMEPVESGTGVDDPGQGPRTENDAEEQPAEETPSSFSHALSGPGEHANSLQHSDTRQTSDRHLFADPYAVLAEIAGETGILQNISEKGDGGAQASGPATGAQGGESYRDPFAPDFWSQEVVELDAAELDVFRQPAAAPEAKPEEGGETEDLPPLADADPLPSPEPAGETAAAPEAIVPASVKPAPETEPETDRVEELAEDLRQQLAQVFGEGNALNQSVSVVPSADGVMISITDGLDFGMFQVGSAVPQRELVLAMERIGQTLASQAGKVRINGHTDGRPFRSEDYDNWRLSSARAQSAYYMLVRGGLDEARVGQVAGFADRELKFPENPLADGNRRIEIFLETNG